MKKYLAILLFLPFVFSCGESEEVKQLKAQKDSLQHESDQRDEAINEFIESFNEIENNLLTIKEKENIISVSAANGTETAQNAKDRINSDILAIHDLMEKNKKSLKYLQRKLKKSNLKIAEFQKMISRMEKQLESKGIEIQNLKEKLANMDLMVDSLMGNVSRLSTESQQKSDVIKEKTDAMNTAYYAVGTKKELIENGVLTKSGGFIGIGTKVKLSDSFNKEYFTQVDIRETDEIEIYSKKAELITTHPGGYTIEGEKKADKLVITDAEKFWSVSKYLVIQVK